MMFYFECGGYIDNKINYPLKFSKFNENLRIYPISLDIETSAIYQTVTLFKYEYHRSSTIKYHIDELFSIARKYFQTLNRAAKNCNMSSTLCSDYNTDFGQIRICITDFFCHIRDTLNDIYNTTNGNSLLKCSPILSHLKESLFSFRLMLKSIDSLPDFVVHNSTSELGNQCTLASYHLYHLYLELQWLNLIIIIKDSTIEQIFTQEVIEVTEELVGNDYHINEKNDNKQYNEKIEKEIEWFLYNLISLSSKCYDKIGPKRVFSCTCVKELWVSLQILLENMTKENKTTDFWNYFNNNIEKYLLATDTISDKSTKTCNNLYYMPKIESNNNLEFCLWLLLSVSELQGYNTDGEFFKTESERIKPNYHLLETIIKKFINNDQNIPEITFREQMNHITKLLIVWWEPKNEIITLLWEYFHKRLNSAFVIPGRDDNSINLQSSSVIELVNDLKLRFSLDNSIRKNSRPDSSFSLFITLLGVHLKKCISSNQHGQCQKIRGRIFPKFTINKILALNEFGLNNFSVLFLVMAVATDTIGVCSKLLELLVQIPFEALPWIKKQIIMKAYLIMLYIHSENGVSISQVAKPLMGIVNKYCSMRDSDSMALMKIMMNGFHDIMDVSTNIEQDEYILIDSWIPKYLTVCPLPELSNNLEHLSSLLSKLKILCSYNDSPTESVSLTIDAFFTHIFNCTKTLFSNGVSALQIAEMSFKFTIFFLENNLHAKVHGNFEDVLKYFTFSETANERVTRQYLLLLLQDDQVIQALEGEKKSCEGFIIHCWIKCALLSTEVQSDDDTHLMLLVCQLSEFSSLNIVPGHGGTGEQMNLCRFFYSIGVAWNNTQNFQEKCRLRERVNQYLSSIDKCVVFALKEPTTLEFVMQLFIILGSLFLHCSPIIYSRAKPSCILHTIVSTILLPPQIFMDKKIHPYITSSICKTWYMFMRGLHQLDYKNDIYVEKTMKDMIVQYLPYFTNKTFATKNSIYEITYRMIPFENSSNLNIEKYILEKISSNFVTCRGKQSHVHASKALAVIHHLLVNTGSINLVQIIIDCAILSIFEQLMFSDVTSPNKKIGMMIIDVISQSEHYKNATGDNVRSNLKDVLVATCRKHLAFNSSPFYKMIIGLIPTLVEVIQEIVPLFDEEISKVEKMRGVGYDNGLRNGLKEIILNISKI